MVWIAIYDPKAFRERTPLLFSRLLELTGNFESLVDVGKVSDP